MRVTQREYFINKIDSKQFIGVIVDLKDLGKVESRKYKVVMRKNPHNDL